MYIMEMDWSLDERRGLEGPQVRKVKPKVRGLRTLIRVGAENAEGVRLPK
jgi:hypothetical protein